MKKRKKKIFIAFILMMISIVYCRVQNNWIKIDPIKIEINNLPKELNGLKIAHISDVHLPKNASSIEEIIRIVKQQKPDIIVMTGDIIDESADLETCGLDRLSKGLSEITKTYAVTGNHELWNGQVDEWTNILTNNHVEVVDNKILIYSKDNQNIAIVGLKDGYEYNLENFSDDIYMIKDMPMILLAHRPELISSYTSNSNDKKPDIIFSGHAHGGQFGIPIINQGVLAPNQGIFPKYTSGRYVFENHINMIVSRGLGNSIIPIRINNRPHLPIIELIEKK